MTLVDSVDAILMLYSYSGFPDRSWAIFERVRAHEEGDISQMESESSQRLQQAEQVSPSALEEGVQEISGTEQDPPDVQRKVNAPRNTELQSLYLARDQRVKQNTLSGLSIILTLMSILVAFRFVLGLI